MRVGSELRSRVLTHYGQTVGHGFVVAPKGEESLGAEHECLGIFVCFGDGGGMKLLEGGGVVASVDEGLGTVDIGAAVAVGGSCRQRGRHKQGHCKDMSFHKNHFFATAAKSRAMMNTETIRSTISAEHGTSTTAESISPPTEHSSERAPEHSSTSM